MTKGVTNKKLKKDDGHFMMEDLPKLIIKKYLDKKEYIKRNNNSSKYEKKITNKKTIHSHLQRVCSLRTNLIFVYSAQYG